jgi:hypothetical protein
MGRWRGNVIKKLLILLILILIPLLADARGLMMMGGGITAAGGACTEPSANATIVGTDNTSSAGQQYPNNGAGVYFNVAQAASWAETCTTTTMSTIQVSFQGNAGGYCKAGIALSSTGAPISNGISNALAVEYEASFTWHTFTMGTPPTLTKDTGYKLFVICDTDAAIIVGYDNTGTTSICFDTDGTYASPSTLSCDYEEDASATLTNMRGRK